VGLFDRLKPKPRPPVVWHVSIEGSDVVADDGSSSVRVGRARARAVRIVPLSGGNPHAPGGGYQVAIACVDGDAPVGKPTPDWRAAHALARQLCDAAELELDEMTARLFSRVGTFT
jgi:hypothetical protein